VAGPGPSTDLARRRPTHAGGPNWPGPARELRTSLGIRGFSSVPEPLSPLIDVKFEMEIPLTSHDAFTGAETRITSSKFLDFESKLEIYLKAETNFELEFLLDQCMDKRENLMECSSRS